MQKLYKRQCHELVHWRKNSTNRNDPSNEFEFPVKRKRIRPGHWNCGCFFGSVILQLLSVFMSADTAESLRDNFQVIFFCLCTVSFVWSIGDAHPSIVSSTSFHHDTVNKHASASSSHPTTLNVNNEKLKNIWRDYTRSDYISNIAMIQLIIPSRLLSFFRLHSRLR